MIRNQAVELLRVLAALGVVWFHAGAPGHDIAYSGLMVFLFLSAYFEARRAEPRPTVQIFLRLIPPWLCFLLLFGVENLLRRKPLLPTADLLGVLAGTSTHLWFLPFMFVALVAISIAMRFAERKAVAPAAAGAALLMAATIALWLPWSLQLEQPLPQYIHGSVPVLLGAALGASGPESKRFVLVAVALMFILLIIMPSPLTVPYAIGMGAAIAAVSVPPTLMKRFDILWLSSATFGIYLVHPVPLALLYRFRDIGDGSLIALLAFAISAAGVVAAHRLAPRLARPVLG